MQLKEDDISECPLHYKDNRKDKSKNASNNNDDADGLDPPLPGPKLTTSTTAYLESLFERFYIKSC